MMRTESARELYAYLGTIATIDTHEHLPAYEKFRETRNDVLAEYLTHYLSSDLVSAGMPPETLTHIIHNQSIGLLDKWAAIAPYWPFVQHTGYGRSIRIAAKSLYCIDHIDGDSIEALNQRFVQARAKGDAYQRILKERCGLEAIILDSWNLDVDKEYFQLACQMSPFVYGEDGNLWRSAQAWAGQQATDFGDFLDMVAAFIIKTLAGNAICLKCSLAYERSLHFPRAEYAGAKAEFLRMQTGTDRKEWMQSTNLQNYMMHHILATAGKVGGVVQFHTGIQEGNGNHLAWTNPILLENLFREYPDVRFDLFHIGYPFQRVTTALAKNYRNVFIDMCWAHIISPLDAAAALDGFLDAVPYNKISAFGGDYCFVDGVVGHLAIARENVACVLGRRVDDGMMDLDEAKHIAKRLFYDNPKALFGL